MARPGVVTAAYVLWLISAVLLIAVGMVAFTLPIEQLREAFVEAGATDAEVDTFRSVLRAFGVLFAIIGLVTALLAAFVRNGDPRFRRALAALSIVFALFVFVAVLAFPPILLISIMLFVAVVLIYRPSARGWFVREQ